MLTQEQLKEYFDYNPENGIFTRIKNIGNAKAGAVAGYLVSGYVYINFKGKAYPAHRLAFLFMNGEFPGSDVDHINMIRSDNRFENLRLSNRKSNMLNTRSHVDSQTNIKNVIYRKDTNKYSVRITAAGKYKSFGSYDDLELASLVAEYLREKYHGEYARHC